MNTKESTGLKKVFSTAVTVLLIICTILCLVLITKSVAGGNVNLFGYRLFYVLTGSMEPTIHAKSLVIVKQNPDNLYEIGDIITFKSKASEIYGQPNTHRIISYEERNGERFYVTQGDANNIADSGCITADDIYGKVIWHSGRLNLIGSLLGFLMTPLGFFLIVLLPILLLTIGQLKDFTKTYKEAVEEAAKYNLQSDDERNGQDERKQ